MKSSKELSLEILKENGIGELQLSLAVRAQLLSTFISPLSELDESLKVYGSLIGLSNAKTPDEVGECLFAYTNNHAVHYAMLCSLNVMAKNMFLDENKPYPDVQATVDYFNSLSNDEQFQVMCDIYGDTVDASKQIVELLPESFSFTKVNERDDALEHFKSKRALLANASDALIMPLESLSDAVDFFALITSTKHAISLMKDLHGKTPDEAFNKGPLLSKMMMKMAAGKVQESLFTATVTHLPESAIAALEAVAEKENAQLH